MNDPTPISRTSVAVAAAAAVAVILLWWLLALLSAKANGMPVRLLPAASDLKQAMTWATQLLGLYSTLTGLLGVSRTVRSMQPLSEIGGTAMSSAVALAAGAVLLGVGG